MKTLHLFHSLHLFSSTWWCRVCVRWGGRTLQTPATTASQDHHHHQQEKTAAAATPRMWQQQQEQEVPESRQRPCVGLRLFTLNRCFLPPAHGLPRLSYVPGLTDSQFSSHLSKLVMFYSLTKRRFYSLAVCVLFDVCFFKRYMMLELEWVSCANHLPTGYYTPRLERIECGQRGDYITHNEPTLQPLIV